MLGMAALSSFSNLSTNDYCTKLANSTLFMLAASSALTAMGCAWPPAAAALWHRVGRPMPAGPAAVAGEDWAERSGPFHAAATVREHWAQTLLAPLWGDAVHQRLEAAVSSPRHF